ncbi:transcription activator [Blechum interveinal chlorosis virus]|uniref:Transcriptional activator protein n=1 Tax=Blechum interveinal chlorosis virus TaxID=1246650 RepID=K4NX76_9GEMI|nr:transcription activator [Blechum interveinal chlorosis virus]AFV48344.1 transcription activator [Blechum interveinal chlorosis virus]
MQNSSSSTPPSIKPQHRIAKKRAIRRKRIDFNCGCSIYQHIDCINYGFTHRGEHHCTSGREFRFYLEGSKSPIFHDTQSRRPTIHNNQNILHPNSVQPQPEEGTESTQSLLQFPNLDDFDSSFWDGLFK